MKNTFRVIAFLEGVSYILLMTFGLYFKYQLGDPTYVKLLGMPHGVLFGLYIYFAIAFIMKEYAISDKTLLISFCFSATTTFLLIFLMAYYLEIIFSLYAAFIIIFKIVCDYLIFTKDGYIWDLKVKAVVLLASILPFGTFYVDWKYLKK